VYRFFADSSLYLNIVPSLATFNIKKAIDEDGKEANVDVKVKPGILSYLTPFTFRITAQYHTPILT
jgi:hypothetical protein